MITIEDLGRLGPAIRAAADEIGAGAQLKSGRWWLADLLRHLAHCADDRVFIAKTGRCVTPVMICATCRDWFHDAHGWLVWTSELGGTAHEMALPLCQECADKARKSSRFVHAEQERRGTPAMRFSEAGAP